MTEFDIHKLCYYAPKKGYYVQLKEVGTDRVISILIDREEVRSIALSVEGIQSPRPTTHDMITDILFNFNIKIKKIEFYNYINNSVYVNLYFKSENSKIKKIDCRPSDGIALALRENCSIFVSDKILKKVGPISDTIFDATQEFNNQGINRKEVIIKKLRRS